MLTDLPNLLTLMRIGAIPLLVTLVALRNTQGDVLACVIYTAACITDYLDGMLARLWKQSSDLGRMMDPIADKLLVATLLLTLAGYGRLGWGALFAAIIILAREILVSGLREYMASQDAQLPSSRLAKWKTGIQMVALGLLIAGDRTAAALGLEALPVATLGAILLWVSAIPTVITGWDYLIRGVARMTAGSQGASGSGSTSP